MYADFHELFKDLFGWDIAFLKLVKSFGFMVAMAFLAAGFVIYKELKRKEDDGLIGFIIHEVKTATAASPIDFLWNAIIGFFIGFKFVGMAMNVATAAPDPMSFIFSKQGSLVAGIVVAILAVALKYFDNKKIVEKISKQDETKAPVVQFKKIKTYPSTRVGDIAVIAALGGFAGAKIFNAFETWEDFLQDPIGNILSSSGLTFYGGLIVATVALWIFARKINLDFRHLCDAAAPALILGYAIGRLGCQVSGDGDWGIYNSAYITNEAGKVVKTEMPFEQMIAKNKDHVARNFDMKLPVPHKNIEGINGLPTWLFAYNYPNNVNHVGDPLAGCEGDYCSVLPIPVFPTPIYEFLMGMGIFLFLWNIRKKFSTPLSIFSIYLIFNGIERFLIEQIRVNYQYDWGFLKPTQAEIIAVAITLFGILIFLLRKKIDASIQKA